MNIRRVIAAVSATAVLAAAACGTGSPASPAATEVVDHSAHNVMEQAVAALANDANNEFAFRTPFIVNLYLSDGQLSPSIFTAPAGRPLQLIVRNRSMQGQGFQIAGLELVDNVWFVREEVPAETPEGESVSTAATGQPVAAPTASLDDHSAHHTMGEMAPRSVCVESQAGCMSGNLVGAEVRPGELAIVMFTAATPGTFTVVDPNRPEIAGKLIVF